MQTKRIVTLLVVLSAMLLLLVAGSGRSAIVSDVKNTKHNLSSGSTVATVKSVTGATGTDQICIFCHTPHAATLDGANKPVGPLWNRTLSTSAYTPYDSLSLQAVDKAGPPSGASKLCLSCHDGTVAIGKVNILNGVLNPTIAMSGTAADGTMPAGVEVTGTSGFTRDLGVDLSNDHPISFTYNSALATADTELLTPADGTHLGVRKAGPPVNNPAIPLERIPSSTDGKVQCTSCHDPHVRDNAMNEATASNKFLRLHRFQENTAVSGVGSFSKDNDQICLGCHSKQGWSSSAHADSTVANEVYKDAAATVREFPTPNFPVWKAACLNCHDSHTVQGAKRLLREGTDSTASPKAGGNAAQEQTCYQCHDVAGGVNNILNNAVGTYAVPDIKTDFTTVGNKSMPIATPEVHNVSDANLKETQALLNTRHAECTDCHNPHRVIKNTRFDGAGATTAGTHEHTGAVPHTNTASGVLKGMWGVEPIYPATTFGTAGTPSQTTGYTVVDSVTKEYQVCLKCHSSYAYGTTPPLFQDLAADPNGTPVSAVVPSSNGFMATSRYTDQAMEFQAPATHKGEAVAGSFGAAANHRSWHPVIDNTGRTAAVRSNLDAANFLAPWTEATAGTSIGVQTMYCTDCHGNNVTSATSVVPDTGKPWGPHGSSNNFILKGKWDVIDTPANGSALCYKCHNKNNYSPATVGTFPKSGFATTVVLGGAGFGMCNMPAGAQTNLHIGHKALVGELRCSWCHTAVPHGWKNKALLVDITGDPVGETGNNCAGLEPCNAAPYYQKAYLGGAGVVNWKTSGNWIDTDCGGGGAGGGWMNNTCNAPQ